ncbi:hypothetical protein KKB99_03540, partial [bacterium]|nr:hypothetical protein [bacterium]MBU1025064.1 hypothetical protein [bacterium]
MTRVKYLFVPLLVVSIILIGSPARTEISNDKLLYNPSVEFVDDFFLALSQGNQVYPETEDASLVLRRLYQISQDVENDNYITAWQSLVNLPEHRDFPVITEIKREALALQSLIPWYSDNELRTHFLRAFDEIWLKYDDINDDLEKFEDVFAGFASSAEDDNPAVYIRDNLRFYGYNKSDYQPSSDIKFIWTLFRNFSMYSSKASSGGFDYRDSDPRIYGEAFMRQVSIRIATAWNQALIGEKIRTGDVDDPSNEKPTREIMEKIEETIPPQQEKIDYSRINIFKLPESAGASWKQIEFFEEPRAIEENIDEENMITEPDTVDSFSTLNPIENGGGLEPPEPITERPAPKIVEIPFIDDEEVEDTVFLVDDDEVPETIDTETTSEEQPLKSAFVSPEVIVINVEKEKPQPEEVIEIPDVKEIVVEEIKENVADSQPTEVINLLKETNATETVKVETPESLEIPAVDTDVIP